MTEKFYNNKFGEKPPFKPLTWPTIQQQIDHWNKQDALKHDEIWDREPDDPQGRMHRCPQCGCLFTGGEA